MKTAIRLVTLVLLGGMVTLPVHASPVRVELRGCVTRNQVHPPASFNEDIVRRGDLGVVSFLVDSENFQSPAIVNTRGYVIDPASYTLTFYTATGTVVERLLNPYPGTPYFVLRNGDPVVDGFFVSTDDLGTPEIYLYLTERGRAIFQQTLETSYTENTLHSLDINDAIGTYGYTGLQRFYFTLVDTEVDALIFDYHTLTISPEPAPAPVEVPVDYQPGDCPNSLNLKHPDQIHAQMPVAILGTATLDVTQINPASVRLNGVSPSHWSLADVGTPFAPFVGKRDCDADCNASGPDGRMDLVLDFPRNTVGDAVCDPDAGQCVVLHLSGNLQDGTRIIGEDVARIAHPLPTH